VREVLRYENEWPLVVREREVAELRARENRHGYVVMTPVPEPFARRAKVRIVGGVLDGRVARYMGEQRGKCRVEVDMLGRVVNLVVPEENLVAA
jgi:transcription antitermination factor NusG